jgi:hypothetical protein
VRISNKQLDEMFAIAGVSKDKLHSCLRFMGTEHLHDQRMKDMWKPEFPSINYCYTVCEYAYWYVFSAGSEWDIRTTNIPSAQGINHWFLLSKFYYYLTHFRALSDFCVISNLKIISKCLIRHYLKISSVMKNKTQA